MRLVSMNQLINPQAVDDQGCETDSVLMFLVELIDAVDTENKIDISADVVAIIAGLIFADGDEPTHVWSTT